MSLVVEARGLTKHYGEQCVVDGIELDVAAGECFGLLGPNGAGKTTILRMLLGMTPPDGGSLTVLDYSIPAEARQMRQQLGVVHDLESPAEVRVLGLERVVPVRAVREDLLNPELLEDLGGLLHGLLELRVLLHLVEHVHRVLRGLCGVLGLGRHRQLLAARHLKLPAGRQLPSLHLLVHHLLTINQKIHLMFCLIEMLQSYRLFQPEILLFLTI